MAKAKAFKNTLYEQEAFVTIGRYLGFPECCIKAFNLDCCKATKDAYGFDEDKVKSPWIGTGFIPCMKCAPAAQANFEQFIAQNIAWRRQAPQPFPNEEGTDEISQLIWARAERHEAADRAKAKAAKGPSLGAQLADRLSWGIIRTLSAVGVY